MYHDVLDIITQIDARQGERVEYNRYGVGATIGGEVGF